ncbi:aldehyde dehydrogenase [Mycolicibacterium sp. CH28]|uniref:aldehyde dehydrogenase n=1 Tax=Mycolicibacterium sp. CH28 TaxID=2512237 RepID=UPI00108004CD|nr:aldehyde dehydrogenase [Mycolicibacterium sp. CH28]TGD87507.1 aldehyde dehydrogenase [Mycolicibacterium sp. CH28]
MTRTHQQWQQLAQEVSAPTGLFIDGVFAPAATGAEFETVDPATGEVIARVARGAAADVDRAVAAARRSFESGVWSRTSPGHRKAVLLRIADSIEEQVDRLAVLESRDGGKLISDTSVYDIPGTAAILRWYAEAIDKVYGEVAPVGPGSLAVVTREPLGVIAAVVPWNFPLEMAMWKIGPALATGNSVVLKPAEATPLTALCFAELCAANGLPDGVLNVVTGYGAEAGQALGRHHDVDAVAFTGSTAVGKLFMGYSAESNLKQVWPECGGKSANIVFDDVADLDDVAEKASYGIFACAGQVCSASSRLLVARSLHAELVEKIVARARAMRIGDPLDPASELGPLISVSERDRVLSVIERAGIDGAALATGGTRPDGLPAAGAYLQPTVLDGVDAGQELFREETFGPVLSVTSFDTEEEAIALANASRYGLAASVFTDSIRRAHRVSERLVAGTVTINAVDAIDVSVPFGGFRQSGFGRDLSLHALEKYTGLKTRWFTS